MPYCRLFYHFIWSTKYREPWILPELEDILFKTIQIKTIGLRARLFAVNAYLDHVHLLVTVPPSISLSEFIGKVKGISSLQINRSGLLPKQVYWQAEYGVFSLNEGRLPSCIHYIENQKSHHAGTIGLIQNWEKLG
jgi:putative transposase